MAEASVDAAEALPNNGQEDRPVNVMETFGNFVINVKVLASEAGVGVPTLPVRILQILDDDGNLSFSKLVEIVIMIGSSQTPSHKLQTDSHQKIQHHVILSFPNPQTMNSVIISSAEELLEVMARHNSHQQLTLVAKVQHQIVDKSSSHDSQDTGSSSSRPEAIIYSPQKRSSSNTEGEPLFGHLAAKKEPLPKGLAVPDLLEESPPTRLPMKSTAFPQPPPKQLLFDPPKFQLQEESPVLVSLMEQLLEIQSGRMQQFANHMEDRFQFIIDQRIVTSEKQLKQCLRDTVQLVEEECKDDDSVSSGDSSAGGVGVKKNGNNLEKIVKDQMVSMELRFAKLEEQSKETKALAKFPPSTPPRDDSPILQKVDSRLEHLEQLMETTRNATVALAGSPSAALRRNINSPGRKPPLPPNHRSTIAVEPPFLLPRLNDEPIPHPVSPYILATPLPPSPITIHVRPPSPSTMRPVSPPPTERNSVNTLPPLTPLSPPTYQRNSSGGTYSTDAGERSNTSLGTASLGTLTDAGMSTGSLGASASLGNSLETNNTNGTISSASLGTLNGTDDSEGNGEDEIDGSSKRLGIMVDESPVQEAMSPEVVQNSRTASDLSIPTEKTGSRGKISVRDMFMAQEDAENEDDDGDVNKKNQSPKASLPIQFPMLDASRGDFLLSTPTQGTPPTTTSAFSAPAQQAIQAPPLASPSPSPDNPSTAVSQSETKMKQAIKDHMQSMESRVSKLRELNKQATTPSTTPAITPATSSSPRTLFPEDSAKMEQVVTEKMESLSESLQITIEDTTKNSIDVKMADMEALLQRKLQAMQKAITLAGSGHGPPSSPQRQSSFQVLEELIDGRLDQLTELIESTQEKMQQQMSVARTNVDIEGEEAPVAGSAIMAQLQSVLDKRMDTIESLVQLTSTELEANSKAAQQRLHQKLLENLVEQMTELINNGMQPGEDSIATSAFPTVYGDDDESIDVHERYRQRLLAEQQQQPEEDGDDDDDDEEDDEEELEEIPTTSKGRRRRSLEADLIAMDRQASIRDIYGDVDIDDIETLNSSGDLTEQSRGIGRAKSLRDICNIDTIEEDEEEESHSHSHDCFSRISENPSGISAESEASSIRSESIRDIYGDDGINIDTLQNSLSKFKELSKESDTPPVMARRSISERTFMTASHETEAAEKAPGSDKAPWRADAESAKKDKPPSPIDRATSVASLRVSPTKKDAPPVFVDRAMSVSTLNTDESKFDSTISTKSPFSKKDRAPSLTERVVSTRAIYGEADIDDGSLSLNTDLVSPGNKPAEDRRVSPMAVAGGAGSAKKRSSLPPGLPDIQEALQESQFSLVSRNSLAEYLESPALKPVTNKRVSTMAVTGAGAGTNRGLPEMPEIPESQDFYDALGIDVYGGREVMEGVYDDLSLDGVDETSAFISSLSASFSSCGTELDESDEVEDEASVDDQASVSIDEEADVEDVGSAGEQASVSIDEGDDVEDSASAEEQAAVETVDGQTAVRIDDAKGSSSLAEQVALEAPTTVDEQTAVGIDNIGDVEEPDSVPDQDSVSIDEASGFLSISSGYDSDSSKEDEEYFRDHERQHLSVLATSMTKVRAARKATCGYRRFQENIFISKRDGPLAVKVKSVSDYDATNDGEQKMTLSDDDESVGEESLGAAEQPTPDTGIDIDESVQTDASICESQYNRAKAAAWTVAIAVTGRRAADRAIRGYRRMLHKKFVPRKKRGPMALTEDSDRMDSTREEGVHSSDYESSTSEVYVNEANLTTEPLAASIPSLDTGGDAMDGSVSDRDMSQPSIDTGGDAMDGSASVSAFDRDMSQPSIDTRGDAMDGSGSDRDMSQPSIDDATDVSDRDLNQSAASIPSIDTGHDLNQSTASIQPVDRGGGAADESDRDMDDSKGLAASIPSIDSERDGVDKSLAIITASDRLSYSNPSIDSGSAFVTTTKVIIEPPTPTPPRPAFERHHTQKTVDSCWEKELQDDDSDSNNEADTSPPTEYSAAKLDESASIPELPRPVDDAENVGDSQSAIFRRMETPEPTETTGGDTGNSESPTKAIYTRSLDEEESLSLGDHNIATAPVTVGGRETPVYAAFDKDGQTMKQSDAENLTNVDVLAKTQEMGLQQDETPDDVWGAIAIQSPSRSPANPSPARSPPHGAEEIEEEGAFKPEQMSKRQLLPPSPDQARKPSWKPFDESESNALETAKTDETDVTTDGKSSGEEKEMEEWEAVENDSKRGSAASRSLPLDMAAGESKYSEDIVVHIQDLKAQTQKWEDVFLVSIQNQRATNNAVMDSNEALKDSHEGLKVSNESLTTSVQESIEDSHHFAAYLDKMLSERIGQLEAAIRSQTVLSSTSVVLPNEQAMIDPITSTSPARAQSAPASPMHTNWTGPTSASRSLPALQGGESKETEHDNRELVISMKRLQDKLRGTEEVAEGYRRQVLQLRSVLEVKINEGNASQHQVEVLQRKLQDAHDREIQAQKQLRPVTKRVEQVIHEMVLLEEHSASLQAENGRLREELWHARREF